MPADMGYMARLGSERAWIPAWVRRDDKIRKPRRALTILPDLTRLSEGSEPTPVRVHLPAAETAVWDRDRVIMRSSGFHRDRVAYQGDSTLRLDHRVGRADLDQDSATAT